MTITTDTPALELLRSSVRGPVLTGFDAAPAAAVWNLSITPDPHVVVGATCPDDVAAAVRYARATGRAVAVHATGHGTFDTATDAVVVTTKRMQTVVVDAARRRARIAAGAKWKTVVAETSKYGLAPLTGSTSDVGAIGYTLGGGLGSLGRKYGFCADSVRSIEIVTADGAVRRIDGHIEPELFWGVRGGKSSFGIVTEIEIELYPVATFYAGALVFGGQHAPAVLRAWQAWAPTLPEETTTSVALMRLPDLPEVPASLRGQLTVNVRFAHQGTDLEGALLLQPIRAAAPLLEDDVLRRPYREADAIHRDPVDPVPFWETGGLLSAFTPDTVERLLAVAGPGVDLPLIMVEVRLMGGQLARQPEHPNAVPGRDAAFNLFTVGVDVPPTAAAVRAAGAALVGALRPELTGRHLANFIGSTTDPEDVLHAYAPETAQRLQALKRTWDPDEVFRVGHVVRS